MKKIIPLLVLLSVTTLLAQIDPVTPSGTAPSYSNIAMEQADSGRYPIGMVNGPVTAKEYCAFLNTKAIHNNVFLWASYYDSHFMTTTSNWRSSAADANASIIRSGINGTYHYVVKNGSDAQIIDSVKSDYVFHEFVLWRANPTVTELCNVLNDQLQIIYAVQQGTPVDNAVKEDKAQIIKSYRRYQGDTFSLAVNNAALILKTWKAINTTHGQSQEVSLCDEQGQKIITISIHQGPIEELVGSVVQGMECYRPQELN
ncbi:MAG: hypothetical protein A3F67_03685 [Verrucomicrobia bacterium RIFCSPHIGHO2_12_FULL_41_10]|nr:MAG: hypothetical protein A3F67_03685 [Verrucomicrobia bacterium RIFCSPHIGHO2_12_FULL_41_10]HLB34388.1 hypothetical protein [Chthoniobacterales bacterium]